MEFCTEHKNRLKIVELKVIFRLESISYYETECIFFEGDCVDSCSPTAIMCGRILPSFPLRRKKEKYNVDRSYAHYPLNIVFHFFPTLSVIDIYYY